ncbi:CpsD/CapB family tyrosine-protein kinase [Companilactobacillus allii]|uniref:Tyrosine-protein kinase CpsD n=1 Tax=Companilactobacillus allii TaxID=1847728 RepID=A0A1P8Q268_9LACO|nr:CpsD/CapB family tyrosine-protein kinase [Companilactobacillus allii]APX71974.1 exopolysaccharide biosynthesis protein [Companilactobacillus allii]USQ69069.1 CpsD/CapB family tyrosine-protein kinase [Companilactobacillus allii]
MWNKKKKLDNNSQKNGINLITYSSPQSPISEQFKTIRTNIQFTAVDKKIKSLVFTSADPSEGKSTVSNNFAVSCATQNTKTILIDADLRRPTIHRTFGLSNQVGLSNYLSRHAALDEIIQPSIVENLSIITSGPIPPNPSELLGGQRIKELLKELDERFDLVILDSPPVNTVTDTQVLASVVDGVVMVVPQGIATKNGVIHAKESLELVHAHVCGAIMNRVTRSKSGYYGTEYYGIYK